MPKKDPRTPAEKRRETIIQRHYGGDEQAYLEGMRAQASRAGKSGGRPFKDPAVARRAINTRWDRRRANHDPKPNDTL